MSIIKTVRWIRLYQPDDPEVMKETILDANPNYVIDQKLKKMYDFVHKNTCKQ